MSDPILNYCVVVLHDLLEKYYSTLNGYNIDFYLLHLIFLIPKLPFITTIHLSTLKHSPHNASKVINGLLIPFSIWLQILLIFLKEPFWEFFPIPPVIKFFTLSLITSPKTTTYLLYRMLRTLHYLNLV